MSVGDVGKQLVDLCREGKGMEAIDKFYSDSVVSVEAAPFADMPQTMEGKQAAIGKNQWWVENNEVHAGAVQGPFVHGDNKFAVQFSFDVTPKGGERMQMTEIGVYTVEDDKIVREEFFQPGQ